MASKARFANHLLAPMTDQGAQALYSMKVEFIENFDYSPIRRDLAKDLGWSEKRIAQVESKAKAFFKCILVSNDGLRLSPDEEIDKFWHLFILRTQLYREFCEQVFGKFIDHQPEDDPVVLAGAFANTRQVYTQIFGKVIPLKGSPATCFKGPAV
ncbi:glycine-rich domain-containing protein [Candidatus Contendibacter odensensis]|uniref:Uncharacterized protein n=1 Tax=Candidatus Contendobacter odensis Run_B_J11 TaxID=1400861 RepID=A0A7U7G8Q2_9GAMM|nr:hypothetical protein [Candidatus Contendobacter odensis]CDH43655.1 hypothetical protein BN874_1270014 [Candidatus Contendobacter odensis Run_B_J11]